MSENRRPEYLASGVIINSMCDAFCVGNMDGLEASNSLVLKKGIHISLLFLVLWFCE
jgi:hypothetical protein